MTVDKKIKTAYKQDMEAFSIMEEQNEENSVSDDETSQKTESLSIGSWKAQTYPSSPDSDKSRHQPEMKHSTFKLAYQSPTA